MNRRKFVFSTAIAAPAAVGLSKTGAAASRPSNRRNYSLMQDDMTLRISLNAAQVEDRYEQLAAGFAEFMPGANIEYIPLQGTDHNDYFSKLLTMIASGNPPDLTFVATEGTQLFAGQGLSIPINDYVNQDADSLQEYFDDVHPSLVESMLYQGDLYMLPFGWNGANMFLNTGAFERAEVDLPGPDWTKDDFYETAKALSGDGNFGYAFVNRMWGGWLPWMFVNNSNLLTEERAEGGEWLWDSFYADHPGAEGRGGGWLWEAPQANSPENVEALEFMVQMLDEGLMPAVEDGGGELLQGFFSTGSVAMTPAGGFWAGGLHNAGMAPDEFDVQFFPHWQSQRHQFGADGMSILSSSPNPDLAWEYVKYSVSEEAMSLYFEGNASTPSRRSLLTAERYEPTGPANWEVFYGTLDEHPDTAPIPCPPDSNEVTSIFMRYTSQATNGQMTPQEALDEMQRELEDLLG